MKIIIPIIMIALSISIIIVYILGFNEGYIFTLNDFKIAVMASFLFGVWLTVLIGEIINEK